MNRAFKTKKIRVLRFAAVTFLILVLSVVLISSLFADNHHCNEDHCAICLLSSSMRAFSVSIKAICTLIVVISALGSYKFNNNPIETLITLKRKLTI